MPNYSFTATGISVDNKVIMGIHHGGSQSTHPSVYEFSIGSDDEASNAAQIVVTRLTITPSGGTINQATTKHDPASIDSDASGGFDGTLASGTDLMEFGLQQRVTFRWVATRGREMGFLKASGDGLWLQGRDITTAFDASATIMFEE